MKRLPFEGVGQKEMRQGWELYNDEKYQEAEKHCLQAVYKQERELGNEHKDTLYSKYMLASIFYRLEKYREAEEVFQQVIQGQEKVLGKEHKDTLDSKYWLALTFYNLKKHREAEEIFQQVVQGQEKVLGKEHKYTLDSKYWLARTFYCLEKYREAEEVYQQVVQGQEKVLGKGHKNTLDTKYSLASTFYRLEKYYKAEEVYQQVVQGQEKVLGKEHKDTLDTRYWLARTFCLLEKYHEAEELVRQVIQVQEKVLGKEHEHTLRSEGLLQELLARQSKDIPDGTDNILAKRLGDFFPNGNEDRTLYSDSAICEISSLLKHSNPRWSKVPRTYIVLRTIDCLKFLDDFIDLGFSDHWFPVTERSLPACLRPSLRAEFVDAQNLVLTKSMDLEKGEKGQHCYFRRNEHFPFEVKEVLGSGGFGQVDKVLSQISFKEYARKRVLRSAAFDGRRVEGMKLFVAEIEILKRLKHRHVVEYVGSYTDPKYIGLIMSPVAEMDLSAYLRCAGSSKHRELRTFFGCLARALEFLHEQKIRHRDIKPGNILVDRGSVMFTDFGLSRDFTDADGSTSVSMVNGMSARYCAPEVAMHEPRNTSSDIWSLGVVFLEALVVLKGRSVEYIDEFFEERGSQQQYIRANPAAFLELITELEGTGSASDNRALVWVQQMLQVERQNRPTATSLITSITRSGREREGSDVFCGICCLSHDDEFSDSDDELDIGGMDMS